MPSKMSPEALKLIEQGAKDSGLSEDEFLAALTIGVGIVHEVRTVVTTQMPAVMQAIMATMQGVVESMDTDNSG